MDEFIFASFGLRLLKAALAVGCLFLLLRRFDRCAEIDFKEFVRDMKKSPLAAGQYLGLRFLGCCILFAALLGCSPAVPPQGGQKNGVPEPSPAPRLQPSVPTMEPRPRETRSAEIPRKYDREIKAAVADYWPDYPFPASWKAQLWQESRFKPDAVSPAGAAGLAQFMPATWDRVLKDMGRPWIDRGDARTSIEAGAFYMARLRRSWAGRARPPDGRQQLAQASYNAGLGSILKAQKACADALLWPAIAPCLPGVTGRHAQETTDYVRLIAKWRAAIEAGA